MAILEVKNLSVSAHDGSNPTSIVSELSFALDSGSILALVGESGSGKSTTALAIADLMPDHFAVEGGEICLEGQNLSELTKKERRALVAKRIGFIYQDALTALNPLMRVGKQVGEALRMTGVTESETETRVRAVLGEVGLADVDSAYDAYPFELSGGMRQRVLIAMALITKPCLLIADESTTALDRRLSDQIIELLKHENEVNQTAILFISHDLSSVARLSDQVLVMRDGHEVERGKTADILRHPTADYTKLLLDAIPTADKKGQLLGEARGQESAYPVAERTDAVMQIRDLCASYGDEDSEHVLEDIDLDIYPAEFVGLLGESGSGKTTIARVLTGQLKPEQGDVLYHGRDILHLRGRARREATRGLGMIFQDPYSSLDPHLSIYRQIEEPLIIGGIKDKKERQERVWAMMDAVELDRSLANRKPSNLSGGQRQRVAIAIATIHDPQLLIADEAVASLDVSIQAQILNLLQNLRAKIAFSCLFIAHDLDVVYYLCDRVAVLYEGHIVEFDTAEQVFMNPQHPYTKDLVSRWEVSRRFLDS